MVKGLQRTGWLLFMALLIGPGPALGEPCAKPASGANSAAAAKLGKQQLRQLAGGTQSGVTAAQRLAVRDLSAWRDLWRKHTSYINPAPPLPSVDFSKEMVLAAFAGNKSSGGHTIKIEEAVLTPKPPQSLLLKVRVSESAPPSGSMTTQAITQPFDMVALPKSPALVDWGKGAGGGVASKTISESEQRKALEYWTPQRMRDAKPMPMPLQQDVPRLQRAPADLIMPNDK